MSQISNILGEKKAADTNNTNTTDTTTTNDTHSLLANEAEIDMEPYSLDDTEEDSLSVTTQTL